MQCPACVRELTERTVEGITVDVCQGGCGGLWFDRFELDKVDEKHEAAGQELLEVAHDDNVHVDHDMRRKCPKCPDMTMRRYFFSSKRDAEVDECPKCAGMWLDKGELSTIRTQFENDKEREAAAHQYFDDLFGDQLDKRRKEREGEVARARATAQMFRFICPSYYIPGKQKWGAH